MQLIQANCRIQFTADDLEFIATTLDRKNTDHHTLMNLLGDEETRDLILDDEQLFHSLLENNGCLRVSNRFYFYIIVRNVLKRAGIDDRGVADYTAELLAQYSQAGREVCQIPNHESTLDYFFEMLAALQEADDRTSFYLRAHIGNHSLFLSGVFPRRIRYRAEKKGFPGMRYYEALGQSNFRIASDHRLAARYELGPIYATLSERFQTARQALNDMSERLVCLGDIESGIDSLLLHSIQEFGLS
jgi:hypothetical protein